MNIVQLEQCIRDYGRELYSFCLYLTGNVQEAEDLYQDTFLKALELRERMDAQYNPKNYLISVALHLWKNKKRKYAWRMRIAGTRQLVEECTEAEQAAEHESFEASAEEQILQKEVTLQVRKAVAELEEKYRIPVYLYYTAQLSVGEISRILKIPEGTVKTRLHKARKLLKTKLEVVLDEK